MAVFLHRGCPSYHQTNRLSQSTDGTPGTNVQQRSQKVHMFCIRFIFLELLQDSLGSRKVQLVTVEAGLVTGQMPFVYSNPHYKSI